MIDHIVVPRSFPLSEFMPFALWLCSFFPPKGQSIFPNALILCLATWLVLAKRMGRKWVCKFWTQVLRGLVCFHLHSQDLAISLRRRGFGRPSGLRRGIRDTEQSHPSENLSRWANLSTPTNTLREINAQSYTSLDLQLFVTQQQLTHTPAHHLAGVRKKADMRVREKPFLSAGGMWRVREVSWEG